VQIYIDGVLNASGTLDTGTKAAQFYLVGALTDRNNAGYVTGANYFNGQLDEVRIYNHVLSASEIAALGQIPSPPSGLSVSTVADSGSILQLSWTNTAVATQDIAIERKIGASGTYEQIATVASTENSYFDTNLDAGTQYFYRVQAVGAAGASDYSNESSAIPPVPEIVGHFIFYNTSSFDGQNGSSNVADGFALATDKQVLLPGETATFANYSSYSKGINGIMIDIKNFEGSITPDDYEIRVGNSSDPTQWDLAPDPTFVTEYPGFGVGGSIRLELVWDNNTIQNEWVQVTLKADANTQLLADDVFYFGNAIGETGNSTTDAIVDGTDVAAVHNNYTATATITNPYDFNRDKVVDATDEAIAAANQGSPALILFTAPNGIHGAGSSLPDAPLAVPSGSAAALGSEIASSTAVEPSLALSSVTFVPSKQFVAPIAIAPAPDRSSSVDAVFDAFEQRRSEDASAASLLNLESSRHGMAPAFANGDDTDHLHLGHASPNGDNVCAVDDLIASDLSHLQIGINLRSMLKRR
jgi:hypothetical protein